MDENKTPTEEIESAAEVASRKSFEAFMKILGIEGDPVMVVLRAHLYSETLLEQIIINYLRRGDRVLENAALSYNQKLTLVDSFDVISDSIISSLRQLNKLRNSCSHELDRAIAEADIRKIGSPLGQVYTKIRVENRTEVEILRHIIIYSIGYLTGIIHHNMHTSS